MQAEDAPLRMRDREFSSMQKMVARYKGRGAFDTTLEKGQTSKRAPWSMTTNITPTRFRIPNSKKGDQDNTELAFYGVSPNSNRILKITITASFDCGHRDEVAKGVIHQYQYYAKGKDLNLKFAGRLERLILSPQSYSAPRNLTKACGFDPGVDFRIWKGKEFVDVAICFRCNELVVFEDARMTAILSPRAPNIKGDFDTVRPQLLALAKEALPGDPVFLKLK